MSLLGRVIAAGGGTAIDSVQSFTGTGTITYFQANEKVSGTATIWGLGASFFRLDAELPDGPRSWAVTNSGGQTTSPDGTKTVIPYENAATMGGLAYPYLRLAAALADPSYSVTASNVVGPSGALCIGLTISQTFSSTEDPTGDEHRLSTKTYIIDPASYVLIQTVDTLWSTDGRMRPVAHAVLFSDIHVIDGRSVPFTITEEIGGQQTWTLQLVSFAFDPNITSALFES